MIKAENVGYIYASRYQRTQALSGVTCSFEKGKLYVVTGESGSGKSTFLSLLAGLDVPTEGSIYIDGRDIRKMNRDRYRREQAAIIYQAFHLFPLLTVLENVMFPMKLQKVQGKAAEARARELLEKVGLDSAVYGKMPNMISGGEQQRVAIARGMASGAEIFLADEPTGNLDSRNESNIVEIMKQMAHEENYVVIMVSHSEKIALSADVVYRMSDGRLEVAERGKQCQTDA